MTKEELIDFLRENLLISTRVDQNSRYYGEGESLNVTVKLRLRVGEQIIDIDESSDSCSLPSNR